MATANSFQDLEIWKRSRIISNKVFEITYSNEFNKYFVLRDQMTRAAISILSNISEGFERSGNKEFVQFLFISKGSAGELLSQVIIATDQKIITEQESNVLIEDLKLIGAQIGSLINYLKSSELKGSKFKK